MDVVDWTTMEVLDGEPRHHFSLRSERRSSTLTLNQIEEKPTGRDEDDGTETATRRTFRRISVSDLTQIWAQTGSHKTDPWRLRESNPCRTSPKLRGNHIRPWFPVDPRGNPETSRKEVRTRENQQRKEAELGYGGVGNGPLTASRDAGEASGGARGDESREVGEWERKR